MLCSECKQTTDKLYTVAGKAVCSACGTNHYVRELFDRGWTQRRMEARLEQLLADPDRLDQWKGVCGFASGVYLLLRHHPKRARNLFNATFSDLAATGERFFVLPDGSRFAIPFLEIMGHQSNILVNHGHLKMVDWCLCRALMHVLSQKDPARYRQEEDFSELFRIKDWFQIGHFAMQTDSEVYLLKTVLGLRVLWTKSLAYRDRPLSKPFEQSTAKIKSGLDLAREAEFMLDGTTSMITALWGKDYSGTWTDATATDRSFDKLSARGVEPPRADQRLEYTHWVIIDSATISPDKQFLTVSMWTWAKRRQVRFKIEHLLDYLREAIFVKP